MDEYISFSTKPVFRLPPVGRPSMGGGEGGNSTINQGRTDQAMNQTFPRVIELRTQTFLSNGSVDDREGMVILKLPI